MTSSASTVMTGGQQSSALVIYFLLAATFLFGYADSINCYECYGHGCLAQKLTERRCPPNVDRCMTVYSNNKVSPDKVLVKNCSQVWVNWRDECNMVVRVDQLLSNSSGSRIPLPSSLTPHTEDEHATSSSSSSSSSVTDGGANSRRNSSRGDVTGYVCTCTGDLCNGGSGVSVSAMMGVIAMIAVAVSFSSTNVH